MTSEMQAYEEFVRSLRSFEWVNGTGVSGASDVDLMLERRGRFLFLESKAREGPQIYVPLGQWIALRSLSKLPGVTVWLVAEDEHAKEDTKLPRYSVLEVQHNTRYHREGIMPKSGQRGVSFYTDKSFEHLTLAGLQAKVSEWWAEEDK
jgi:hypothetical protein